MPCPQRAGSREMRAVPEAGIHRTFKRYRNGKETTSKPRTAAAGGALARITMM